LVRVTSKYANTSMLPPSFSAVFLYFITVEVIFMTIMDRAWHTLLLFPDFKRAFDPSLHWTLKNDML